MKNLRRRTILSSALFALVAALTITVLVAWITLLVQGYLDNREFSQEMHLPKPQFPWTVLTLGSLFFTALLGGLTTLFTALVSAWRRSRREREFLAMITHELKSPLASIKLAAQTIERAGHDGAAAPRFAAAIVQETERLTGLVDNVLDAVRADGTPKTATMVGEAPIKLDSLLADIIEEVRPRVEMREGRIKERLNSGARIRANTEDIGRVFGNLLDNAIKYAEGPPRIAVVSTTREDQVIVTVSDRGRGIDRRDLQRIFRRFERGRGRIPEGTPATYRSGVGLGLYLVERLVRKAGGMVTAYSAGVGQGATFTVMLPLLPPDPDAGKRSPRTPSEAMPPIRVERALAEDLRGDNLLDGD